MLFRHEVEERGESVAKRLTAAGTPARKLPWKYGLVKGTEGDYGQFSLVIDYREVKQTFSRQVKTTIEFVIERDWEISITFATIILDPQVNENDAIQEHQNMYAKLFYPMYSTLHVSD